MHKIFFIHIKVLLILILLFPSELFSQQQECFLLMVGKDASANGQLRDYYSGTPFDIFKNKNLNNPERSIAVWNCVHTDVITLSPGKPTDYGSVLWTGLSSPFTAIYTPIYFGSKTIPSGFDLAPTDFDNNSAFWIFKSLGDLCKSEYPDKMKAWKELRNQFESNEIKIQEIIIRKAENIKKNHPNQLSNYLETKSKEFAFEAMKLASDMIDSLELKNENKITP